MTSPSEPAFRYEPLVDDPNLAYLEQQHNGQRCLPPVAPIKSMAAAEPAVAMNLLADILREPILATNPLIHMCSHYYRAGTCTLEQMVLEMLKALAQHNATLQEELHKLQIRQPAPMMVERPAK